MGANVHSTLTSMPDDRLTEIGLAGGEIVRVDLPLREVLDMLSPSDGGLDAGFTMLSDIDWPGEYHFNPAHVTFVREAKPAKSRQVHFS